MLDAKLARPPKRLVAFSLYGESAMYRVGAVRNLELQKIHYPGWTTRIYVSQEIPAELTDRLLRDGAEVVQKQRHRESDGMFWRFLPAAEEDLDALIVRDTDSRLGARERRAVEEWLASGLDFHIMRDHPYHGAPILGGAWGVRGGVLPDMGRLLDRWQHHERKGRDQDFLAARVYPLIEHSVLVHSDLIMYAGERPRGFPGERSDLEFVGEIVDEHEQRGVQPEEVRRSLAQGRLRVYPRSRRRHAHARVYRLARSIELAARRLWRQAQG
jgi:hypothetical protein